MTEQIMIETTNSTESYNDLLDRKKLAKNFVDVVNTQNANVYSINAPWGSGKTWFLKFIEEECNQQQMPFVQFNVWETDYAKDPFQAILCELLELLNKQIEENKTSLQNIYNLVCNKAKELNNIRKRASYSIGLNIEQIISAEMIVNPDESTLYEYNEMKKRKKEFISELNKFVDTLGVKLIIAIDELDRCRPDYAITTLEIIKHFFNIDNVIFILAVDKEQLQTTVKTMFGLDTDTDAYLRKFVDIQYQLPNANIEQFIKYLIECKYPLIKKSLSYLINKQKVLQRVSDDEDIYIWTYCNYYEDNLINDLCTLMNFTLRDIDKICLKLNIILPILVKQNRVLQLEFLIRLILINTKNIQLYEGLKALRTLQKYSEGSIFDEVYKMLYNLHKNPRELYYTQYEYKLLASSYKDIKSYFSIIDFAEDFS